jgi:large subunit ribosomal protein L5
MQRLLEKYKKEVVPEMMKKFGYKNSMAVPRIVKVVLNTGFGKIVAGKTGDEQKKIGLAILEDLGAISGQRPSLNSAKKSIAGFKVRQGTAIGASVTLRGKKMYDFLERLISIALPRSRDFRGLSSKSFDQRGSFSLGIKEHIIFPEVSPEKSKNIFGLEISVMTSAKTKEEGMNLLKAMEFPIKQNN